MGTDEFTGSYQLPQWTIGMFREQIDYYLTLVRQGDFDSAFHGLRKLSPGALAELIEVFRSEHDAEVRELIVRSIWEWRDTAAVGFLGDALRDVDARVWKQALDGLVALGSNAAVDVLTTARSDETGSRRDAAEYQAWIEEAIEQIESRWR
jgi:hypothetical protein